MKGVPSHEKHTKGKGMCFSIGFNSEAVLVIKSTGKEELIILTATHSQHVTEGYGMCLCVCVFTKIWETMKIGRLQIIQKTNITRDFC